MHDLTLTKAQMRKVKAYLASKEVSFPNTKCLLGSFGDFENVTIYSA